MPCTHDWVRYDNIPPGRVWPYWQCTKCHVIGYSRDNGSIRKEELHRKVTIVVCHHQGCSGHAIGRLPGYFKGNFWKLA